MNAQPDLFGAPAGPRRTAPGETPTDRLLFALFPSPSVAEQIAATADTIRRRDGLRGECLATDRLHVTLHKIGDYVGGLPERDVKRASEAGSLVASLPFDVSFDRTESFDGRAAKVAFALRGEDGLGDVIAFRLKLVEAMARCGLKAPPAFTPHVTLLYDEMRAGPSPTAPLGWTATEFKLVHSLYGQTRYITLGKWKLVG